MHLTKHHGLGNDFLVLADPAGVRPIDARLAVRLCDRHRGIGADGLLHLGPGRDGADVSMVLLNADGSRAEMSGNGIGCLVQAALRGGLAAGPDVLVATDAGPVEVVVVASTEAHTMTASVRMSVPRVDEVDEPEWTGGDVLRARRVSVGNPHLVLFAANPELVADRDFVAELGRKANEAIVGGVNVEVIAIAPDGDSALLMDVYERGVGLTDACGTGAVASAAAAHRWELTRDDVEVHMHGGVVHVDLSPPTLTTPITYVGALEVPA